MWAPPHRSMRFKLMAVFVLAFGVVFTGIVLVGQDVARSAINRSFDDQLRDRARQMVAVLVQSAEPFSDASLAEAIEQESKTIYYRAFLVQVRELDGTVLAQSESLGGRTLPLPEGLGDEGASEGDDEASGAQRLDAGEEIFSTIAWPDIRDPEGALGEVRMLTLRFESPGVQPVRVQVATSLEPVAQPLAVLNRLAWTGLGLGLLAAALASWIASGRAMKRFGQVAAAVRTVTVDELTDYRIEAPSGDVEITRLVGDLNLLLERVEAGLKAREGFIQDVSHELKTPLSVVLSQAQVLQMSPKTDARSKAFATSVAEEIGHLARLVESLLALARADAKRDLSSAREASVFDVVVAAVQHDQPLATERGVSLELSIDDEQPNGQAMGWDDGELMFFGDPDLVTSMLSNLIRNAISVSETGGRVRVRVGRSAGSAEIRVEDQGPGIPDEAIARIFRRFEQARGHASRYGSGLGLAIAQAVAKLHGGTLAVENLKPHGCRFTATLPLEPPSDS